jgi:hypothetical protein
MRECVFTFNRIEIVNQKTDTAHSDNDWLSMVWSINDQVYSKTIQLVNVGGSAVLHSGDVLRPFQDYVVCQSTDTVMVVYAVINLSSYDRGKQAEAAAEITQGILKVVAPIYLQAAAVVLGVAASGGLGAPAIIQQIAGGSSPLLQELSNVAGDLIDTAFNNVVTPLLKDIVEFFARLIGGHPNCNGEVFHDYVIFLPNQPVEDLHISKTYTGPQTNHSCGSPPNTKVDITLHREGIELPQADWRFCERCQAMFYDGYPNKGRCPARSSVFPGAVFPTGHDPRGHLAAGYNFLLPHDTTGPGQAQWRFCQKCQAMFFDGYPDKGRCTTDGGGHLAAGYDFVLPHDVAGPGQRDWRYCQNCHVMFYDGYPSKGVCAAAHTHVLLGTGEGHVAAGYNFVLNHK